MQNTVIIALLLLLPLAVAAKQTNPVTTVKSVDLNRYLGKWYQFAYFPNNFQPRDCGLTTAEYSLDKKGRIIVLNTCYEDATGNRIKKQASGKAYPVDKTNSKLKVSFFWPFKGDYWIVRLDPNYQLSIVSDPQRKYLWILTRSQSMAKVQYQELVNWLNNNGWDTGKLVVTGTLR